jgi:hypothetical protein
LIGDLGTSQPNGNQRGKEHEHQRYCHQTAKRDVIVGLAWVTADQKSCALALRRVAPLMVRWRVWILMSAS